MAATVSVLPEISEEELTEFRMLLGGEALRPGDPGYDRVRPSFSQMYADKPGLVVLCKGTADVVAAVDFARARGIEVTVRGGGHSVAGLSSTDGGMVIDLAPMNGVLVDKECTAGVRPGRSALGRRRPRGAALRPLDTRRRRLRHRRRGADARRRLRLAAAHVRALVRQRDRLRGRDGRRQRPERVRRREHRPVLGAARRRRQLRDRHPLHLQASSGRADRRLRRRLLPRPRTPRRCCAASASSPTRRLTRSIA